MLQTLSSAWLRGLPDDNLTEGAKKAESNFYTWGPSSCRIFSGEADASSIFLQADNAVHQVPYLKISILSDGFEVTSSTHLSNSFKSLNVHRSLTYRLLDQVIGHLHGLFGRVKVVFKMPNLCILCSFSCIPTGTAIIMCWMQPFCLSCCVPFRALKYTQQVVGSSSLYPWKGLFDSIMLEFEDEDKQNP